VNILLDTHVWLWWTLGAEDRLPKDVRNLISSGSNRVVVSIVSLWEIALKSSLGKLTFPRPPASYASKQMRRQHFDLLVLEVDHLDALAILPYRHRDPFDRLLIAQAQTERLTLVTADDAFNEYDFDKVVFRT